MSIIFNSLSSAFTPIYAPFFFDYGCNLSWVSNTQITVGQGQFFSADGNNFDQILVPTTVSTTYVGLNGLDTGTVQGDSPYAVYKMWDTTDLLPSGYVLSLNFTKPLLVSGYSSFRRVGSVATTNSGNIFAFFQTGNGIDKHVQFDSRSAPILTAGNATGRTAISVGAYVGVSPSKIYVQAEFTASATASVVNIDSYPSILGGTGTTVISASGTTAVTNRNFDVIAGNHSGNASFNYFVSSGSDAVSMFMVGYDDNL